ncbi:unnamed protein product [Tetraodon nigroviridis]|uniref:(spotted green pufferfish) hypothetical protein n=1 Tax=Tetraodon nigroviridis TaxID=99883 RepID=Q4RTM9_TETNG|nr:unnamed protein product [Tetraodon nigroviridis]
MAVGGGWLSWLVALLSATSVLAHGTYHVSVGHLFVLKCRLGHANVSWSREGTQNQGLPAGVEARGNLLLFQPVHVSHNGSYTCEKSVRGGCWQIHLPGGCHAGRQELHGSSQHPAADQKCVQNRRQVNSESTLSISKVRREFLNVPFRCHVVSPADRKIGLLYLQEAPDGKLYDAYVSYLHPSSGSSEAAAFALQILPEKLETRHGYSLYIRGRDDSAGEGLEKVFPFAKSAFRQEAFAKSLFGQCLQPLWPVLTVFSWLFFTQMSNGGSLLDLQPCMMSSPRRCVSARESSSLCQLKKRVLVMETPKRSFYGTRASCFTSRASAFMTRCG